MSRLKFTTFLLGTAASLLGAGPSLAQEALEEIVVTARRQEESLQRTPVSVSALSGDMLDRLNLTQVDRIAQFTPNVSLTESSGAIGGIAPFIRGIGNQEPLLTVDSPVGIYLNGVYIGRQSGALFDLLDLARVEVLRGPQGTLFGRNTTGGAINMVTRRPDETFGAEQKFTIGSFGEFDARTLLRSGAIGNSPISATLGYSHRQNNGWVDNVVAPRSQDPGAVRSDAGFVALAGDWGGFKADYLFDYSFRRGKTLAFQIAAVSPDVRNYYNLSPVFLGDPLTVQVERLGTIRQENGPRQFSQVMGHSLTLQQEISDALTVKSITGYRQWRANQYTVYAEPNLQGVVLDPNTFAFAGIRNVTPFHAPLEVHQRQWSQELQVLGQVDRWKYVGGLYYFSEDVGEYNPTPFTFVLPGGQAGLPLSPTQAYTGDSRSYAAFGQASFTPPILDDKLSLTAGLRYTTDKRSLDQNNPATPGTPALSRSASKTFHNLAFNTSVDYQWTDTVMTYARVGSGYRSGGFNARAPAGSSTQLFTFNPEKALTVEGGFKTEFFDRRLRANAAGFYTRYRSLQVAQYTGGQGTTQNANARFTGFEVEAQAIPMRGLTIDASIGYVKPEYTRFPYPDPTSATGALADFAGQAHFPYVPKWTSHVGAEYAIGEVGPGVLSVRADYTTSSKRRFHALNLPNANPFNDVIADPGNRSLSARLTLSEVALGPASGEISLWSENITNHDNVVSGIDFGGLGFAGRSYGPPRRVGVDLRLSY